METNLFEQPVTIFVGLGLPTTVNTVAEAFTLLAEWPGYRQSDAYKVAMRACRAALAGEIDAETARSTFVAFAKRTGILAPSAQAVIPNQEVPKYMQMPSNGRTP